MQHVGLRDIRRNTDSFQDAGRIDHGRCIRESKFILTWFHRGLASIGKGAFKKGNVNSLGFTNLFQGVDAILAKAEGFELAIFELVESLLVEGCLQMLQSQGTKDQIKR